MTYTCSDYRAEMMLLSLRRRLERENLSDDEKEALKIQIDRIEKEMGMH